MRRSPWPPRALLALSLAACGGPTGDDIDRALDEQLRSVAGAWVGIAPDQAITLAFQLTEGAGGQVTGTGTMQERGAPTAVPITVSGSYQRPVLALTFGGIVYEGRAVTGTFGGNYTSVGGVADALVLTAPGYSASVTMLLQEAEP